VVHEPELVIGESVPRVVDRSPGQWIRRLVALRWSMVMTRNRP